MAAAAALVIGVLGVKVVRQDDQIDRVQQALGDDAILRAANVALLDPDAVTIHPRVSPTARSTWVRCSSPTAPAT